MIIESIIVPIVEVLPLTSSIKSAYNKYSKIAVVITPKSINKLKKNIGTMYLVGKAARFTTTDITIAQQVIMYKRKILPKIVTTPSVAMVKIVP
jgi:hypothetical protein